MVKKQKKFFDAHDMISFLLIIGVFALSYLLKINQLGFYRDDWFLLHAGNTEGWPAFIEMWSIDRPFDGYYFGFIYSVFGNSALLYNISAVIIRFMGVVSLYFCLRIVWPDQRIATTMMAAFFAVYPGFMQLPNALEFHPHVMGIFMELLSIWLSLLAVQEKARVKKYILVVAAMLTSLLTYLLMDYYIGMEGMRFALLFYVWMREEPRSTKKRNWKCLIKLWLPYLVSTGTFLFWRVFVFSSERMVTDIGQMASTYSDSPVYAILRTLSSILIDLMEVSVLSWIIPTQQFVMGARLRDFLVSLSIGFMAIVFCLIAFWALKRSGYWKMDHEASEDADWALAAFWIGLFSIVFTLIPIAFGNRNVVLATIEDRFALPGSAGAAIFLVGTLFYSKNNLLKYYGSLLLIGVAVMGHYLNAGNFSNWWQDNSDIWWQLSWRAPDIADNTLLMGSLANVPISEGYSLWSPASMIYYPGEDELHITGEVINTETMHQLFQGISYERDMRGILYQWSYENMLFLSKPAESSCLHVMDGNQLELSVFDQSEIYLMAPYSKIDLIQTDENDIVARPPEEIFGVEPQRSWCYFYQKAALARQKSEWLDVMSLRDEARENGYKPNDWIEWMPFVEAAVMTGNFDEADQLIVILKSDPIVKSLACQSVQDDARVGKEPYQYLISQLCE